MYSYPLGYYALTFVNSSSLKVPFSVRIILMLFYCEETEWPQQHLYKKTFNWCGLQFRCIVHYHHSRTWPAGRRGAGEGTERPTSWSSGTGSEMGYKTSKPNLQWHTCSNKVISIATEQPLQIMSLSISLRGPITFKLPQSPTQFHISVLINDPLGISRDIQTNIWEHGRLTKFSYIKWF